MASNEVKKTLQLINNITQNANVELKIQSLTKIKSNLTNNTESLKIFKQLCGFKHLCCLLKDNTNVKVVNLVLSILANSAMNEEVRKEIVVEHHVLQYVFSTLEYIENPSLHCRAIRLVANVSRTSAYSKYVMRFPFLPKIVGVLTSTSSSDSIITCIRAIKYLWLWDQYRINNELMSLNAIKHILDKLTLLSDKPTLILSHLQMIQTMLNVNTKAFISRMSYLHYEWMVNLLRQENGQYDSVLVQILLKLSAYSKTHFELAKTSLLERIIGLIWPHDAHHTRQTYLLVRIIAGLCKENLFRQKIIQTPYAIQALLTYLDMDCIDIESNEEARDVIMDDDAQSLSAKSTRSAKPDQSSTGNNLTNSIHYYILMAINHYQYDHEGLYRFLRCNLIPILMKRLKGQIEQYEYKHSSPVCDQSKYLSSKQTLNTSGNMSPLSPNYSSGNFSPTNSSSPPRYMSPVSNPWSPVWNASTSSAVGFDFGLDSTNEIEEEMKDRTDNDDGGDDDDKSVYSPLIDFSDDDTTLSNHGDEDTQTDASSSILGSTSDSQEERLDVHIIRIMLHISYMKCLFDHLSLKQTWTTLIDYLVKVQQDDCSRNVYKILLIICKNRAFLRSLLVDNFILHVHKKLIRTKHGTHCMICNNVMIYGQGIINEISNETNSHYGYEEIMIQYRHQDQQLQQLQQQQQQILLQQQMQLQHSQLQEHHHEWEPRMQQNQQQLLVNPNSNPSVSDSLIIPFTTHPSYMGQSTNDPNLATNPVIPSSLPNSIPPGDNPNPALLSIQPSNIPPTIDPNVATDLAISNPYPNPSTTNSNLATNPVISSPRPNPNLPISDPNLATIPAISAPNPNPNMASNPAISSPHINPNPPTIDPNLTTNPAISNPIISNVPYHISHPPNLIHFMIPYLLKDHPSFNRLLFGSDAILFRILSELEGSNQEEAVSCVEELLSGVTPCIQRSNSGGSRFCRGKCAPRQVTYEGDLTFVLDDGTTLVTNRQLLIHKSLYFETMLCGNFKECDQKSAIKLSRISSACLSHLLKLIGSDSCTCALPRTNGTNVLIYLELIIKSDEYLLHELNYRLIQLLYGSSEVVNATNVHLVYEWSLRYNEFVQSCLTNYENYFSKATPTTATKESPSGSCLSLKSSTGDWQVTQGVKRVKLSDKSERNYEENEIEADLRDIMYKTTETGADLRDKMFGTSEEMDSSVAGSTRDEKNERNLLDSEMNENAKQEQGKQNEKYKENEEERIGSERMEECNDEKKEEIVNKTAVNSNKTDVIVDEPTLVACSSRDKTIEHCTLVTFCDEQEISDTNSDKTIDKKYQKDVKSESFSNPNYIEQTNNETSIDGESRQNNVQTDKNNSNLDNNKLESQIVNKTSHLVRSNKDIKRLEIESMDVQPGCSHDKDNMKETELTNISEIVGNIDSNIDENNANINERLDRSLVENSRDYGKRLKVDQSDGNIDKNNDNVNENERLKGELNSKENEIDTEEIIEQDDSETQQQPCLIGDLIDEINKNQTSLSKVSTTMSSCVQDQGKGDQLKNILLLKNEPSFKLRKRVSNISGKRKLSNVGTGGNKRREDLNIFLVKLIFGYSTSTYSSRKCVEIVRNIIEMSRNREKEEMSRGCEEIELEVNIFDQFKQDIYDLIEDNLS